MVVVLAMKAMNGDFLCVCFGLAYSWHSLLPFERVVGVQTRTCQNCGDDFECSHRGEMDNHGQSAGLHEADMTTLLAVMAIALTVSYHLCVSSDVCASPSGDHQVST